MKAGSILFAWLNFWIWIISFRIFGYVSLYPLRYDKTYLTIWIRVLRFDGLSRMLPAFICTNLHFNILPETPTSPSGVPAWARNRAVFKRGVVMLLNIYMVPYIFEEVDQSCALDKEQQELYMEKSA